MSKFNKIKFKNSYAEEMYEICQKCSPSGFNKAEFLLKNFQLAKEFGLDAKFVESKECLDIFSGVSLPENSNPIAQAYAGHQFGHYNPQLGDGRAILIGEINNRDIQLKGIGQTPFSRRGDGKSSLGPVLREYVISEFMHTLNIPTTRALFAIKTNENVIRETKQPGGVLVRVAKSHIRIGTFEYARAQSNKVLKSLADYSINRHFPELNKTENKYLSFFAAVCDKQASLISKWMSIGFVHGVMNTDNMTISGETIDYGPCAFMDDYDPKTVFSSIDHHGRYAYKNQPSIMVWNLTKFAESLIPLIHEETENSVKELTEILQLVIPSYKEYFYKEFSKKLGLSKMDNKDIKIIEDYLKILKSNSIDFTKSFRDLSKIYLSVIDAKESVFINAKDFTKWYKRWNHRLDPKIIKKIDCINPSYIPRNHIIENALMHSINNDDSKIRELIKVISQPFEEVSGYEDFTSPSKINTGRYVTYCGT